MSDKPKPLSEKPTPETLRAMAHAIETSARQPFPVGPLTIQWLRECADEWANLERQLATMREAGERIERARNAERKTTGAFIVHLDGKRNADRYWELREAAENANAELNAAIAAWRKAAEPPQDAIVSTETAPRSDEGGK